VTAVQLLKHMRLGISVFLMPTYLFALSQIDAVGIAPCFLCFVALHMLLYPSSHAYNNYMDNDFGAVSGIASPLPKNRNLLYASATLDVIALIAMYFLSTFAALLTLVYICGSRAYSYRGIRLKQYPIASYICVSGTQGLIIYYLTAFAVSKQFSPIEHLAPALLSSMFIASAYPITQIYQHETDKQDGIVTMSALLGVQGTFRFSAVMYTLTHIFTCVYLYATLQHIHILVYFALNLVPTVMFLQWQTKAQIEPKEVNYKNTMKIAGIASICSNICFIVFCAINKS
jgi:1,4-dihydroxy-2-naphthoate polyprenyltransferase